MKGKTILLAGAILLLSGLAVAEVSASGKEVTREPSSSDFTADYINDVAAERNKDLEREKLRREHDKYLQEITRAERITR